MIVEDGSLVAWIIDTLENLFDSKVSKVQVGDMAFSISASARRRIVRYASAQSQKLVPCLLYAVSFRTSDKNGNEISGYNQGHFVFGFDKPGTRELEFELSGLTIAMGRETLAALSGKTLVLKTVAVGRPDPKSTKSALLIAE